MQGVGSLNADRRPDLRQAIIDNTFQEVTCEHCGQSFRLEPEFTHMDVGREQWIAALPARKMVDFREMVPQAVATFDIAYGPSTPEAVQAIGRGLNPRVTFGWPALREKLLLREGEFDDGLVEVMKFEMLRRLDEVPIGADLELRFEECVGDQMMFVWIDMNSEEISERVTVPRSMYDAIAENPEPWAPLLGEIRDSMFVDMRKLFFGEETEAPETAVAGSE